MPTYFYALRNLISWKCQNAFALLSFQTCFLNSVQVGFNMITWIWYIYALRYSDFWNVIGPHIYSAAFGSWTAWEDAMFCGERWASQVFGGMDKLNKQALHQQTLHHHCNWAKYSLLRWIDFRWVRVINKGGHWVKFGHLSSHTFAIKVHITNKDVLTMISNDIFAK